MKNIVLIKHSSNWGLNEVDVLESSFNALKFYGYDKDVELSVLFVGRKKARDLNIKYRNKDYYPQVLGFPMSREKDGDGVIRLGDVVICTQKLKYEAIFQKKTIKNILDEWMLHGVENLLK